MADSSNRRTPLTIFGLAVAAVAVVVVVMLAIFSRATDTETKPIPNPLKTTGESDAGLKAGEIAAKERELEEKKAVAELARNRFATKLKAIEADVSAFEEETKLWKTDVEPLLTNEGGRRIASSEKASETFFVIYSQERPDAGLANELRESIELLRKQVEGGDKSNADALDFYQPGEALQKEASLLAEEAKEMSKRLRDDRKSILALMSSARPAEITLQERLDQLQKQAEEERAEAIAKAKREAFKEGTDEIAKAEADLIRKQEELKRQSIENKAKEEQRALRLEFVKNNTEMLALLTPLTGKGKKQPGVKLPTLDPQPVSLSKLKGAECLSEDSASLGKLAYYLYKPEGNDRKVRGWSGVWRVGYAYDHLPADGQEYVRQVQAFIREYGQELVQLGHLAP